MSLVDVKSVKPVKGTLIWIEFEDGLSGELDLSEFVDAQGVFSQLKDPSFMKSVFVNSELGTIEWPNGADICADTLYSRLQELQKEGA